MDLTYGKILKELESMADSKNIKGMARYGIIYNKAYGISIYKLRDIAKTIGKNHELALKLWETGIREARLLAVFLADPKKITPEQMDSWAESFECWDDCDQAATSLFDQTPLAWSKVREWAERDEELVKRAAFSMIAGLAVHDKQASDNDFIKLFPVIKKASTDDRNYVKKAVNWALRAIGKRSKQLNKRAVKLSQDVLKIDSKSAKWIARKALRELESDRIRKRLQSKEKIIKRSC